MPDTLGLSTFKTLQRPQRAGQVHIAGIPEEDLSGQIHRGDFKRLAPIVMKKRRVSSHIAILNYLDGTHDCLCNQKKTMPCYQSSFPEVATATVICFT